MRFGPVPLDEAEGAILAHSTVVGDRRLRLLHKVKDGILLDERSRDATLRHIRRLWGYEVSLAGVDMLTGATVYERSTAQMSE